jgi:hypothetical protein
MQERNGKEKENDNKNEKCPNDETAIPYPSLRSDALLTMLPVVIYK